MNSLILPILFPYLKIDMLKFAMSPTHNISISQPWEHLHGVLNIQKPLGWTSHDVVAKLRKLTRLKKIGHGGTLDPGATGVLPILVGKATRLSEYFVEWDKEYRAILRLGQETDTQDASGIVTSEKDIRSIQDKDIHRVVQSFQGPIQQIPPMFSAVKIGGQPLYRLARQGREVDRASRWVTIHRMEVRGIHGPCVELTIVCSKGTYVRTLCADIGNRLGVGGHLSQLERTRVGPLNINHSLLLDHIQEGGLHSLLPCAFLTLDQALEPRPMVKVNDEMVARVKHGMPIPLAQVVNESKSDSTPIQEGELVRVKDPTGQLLALARFTHVAGEQETLPVLIMKKVLVSADRVEEELIATSALQSRVS